MRGGARTAVAFLTAGLAVGCIHLAAGAVTDDAQDPCREAQTKRWEAVVSLARMWTRFDLTQYSSVFVPDCTAPVIGARIGACGAMQRMPDVLAALVDRRAFPVVERRAPRPGERGLVVQVEIQQYDPACQLGFVVRLRPSEGNEKIQALSADESWVSHVGSFSLEPYRSSGATVTAPIATYHFDGYSHGDRPPTRGRLLTTGDYGPLIAVYIDSAYSQLRTYGGRVALLYSDSSVPSVAMRCSELGLGNGPSAEYLAAAQVAAWLSCCRGMTTSEIVTQIAETRHASEPAGPHGTVHFVRRKSIRSGSSGYAPVAAEIDRTCLGLLDRGGVLTAYVAPGAHQARIFRDGVEASRPLQVEAGKTYVLDVELTLIATSLSKPKETAEDKTRSFCGLGELDLTRVSVQGP
jgi:hypothetical protein